MPTLEIFMMASPSGRCASVNCAIVNCGNRGSLPTADVDEPWPAKNPRPAASSATLAPPSLRIVVIRRFPLPPLTSYQIAGLLRHLQPAPPLPTPTPPPSNHPPT